MERYSLLGFISIRIFRSFSLIVDRFRFVVEKIMFMY